MFRIENNGTQANPVWKAVATPDIAKYGLMNISKTERPMILSKIDQSFTPLSGGQFTIYRYDRTVVETGLDSDLTGIYYVGRLPYGTYLVEETMAPGTETPDTSDDYTKPNHFFVFSVDANGVHNGDYRNIISEPTKITNILKPSEDDIYKTS